MCLTERSKDLEGVAKREHSSGRATDNARKNSQMASATSWLAANLLSTSHLAS